MPTQAQGRLDSLADNTEVFNFSAVPVVIEEVVEEIAEPTAIESSENADAEQLVEETAEPQAEKP